MSAHEELLQRITNDYYRASRSWIFFIESNGSFDVPKKSLVEALNQEHLGHPYNVFQNLAISDCILSLCRLTDPYSLDRQNLNALKHLLELEGPAMFARAQSHYSSPGTRAWDESETEALEKYNETYSALLNRIGGLIDSPSLAVIRKHRNNVLAHSLTKKVSVPKLGAVENVLNDIKPIVTDGYAILRFSHFILEVPEEEYQRKFGKFWKAVELGARSLTDARNRELEELKIRYGIKSKNLDAGDTDGR